MEIEFQPPGLAPGDLPRPPTRRDLLLEAAERRLASQGAAGLSVGSVAAEAGVPRDAVRYHFPEPARLLAALLDRVLDRVETAQEELAAEDWEVRGRWCRAYLRCAAGEAGEDFAGEIARLFDAGAERSALRARLLVRTSHWQERMERDGLEPGVVRLVGWAADGLWLSLAREPLDAAEDAGSPGPDAARRALSLLRRLTLRSPAGSGSPAAGG